MFPRQEGDSDRIGFDMTFLMLGMFLFITIILIHFIGEKKDNDASSRQQGNLLIELFWDDDETADVDLWVMAPGQTPVGYSNLGGPIVNLLRDDLGVTNDISGKNMEIATTRGIPSGEYAINVHMYNPKSTLLPITVKVVISLKPDNKSRARQIFSVDVVLSEPREERTVIRFVIDDEKRVVRESVNHEYIQLRTGEAFNNV